MKRVSGLLLLVPLLLAGCTPAPPPSFVPVSATIRPPVVDPDLRTFDVPPSIRWVGGSTTRVLLTMEGGVSCPPVPARIEVVTPVKVILRMKVYTGVCTTDTGPKSSEFSLPASVSRTRSVRFTMTTTDPVPDQTAVLRAPTR